MFYAFVTHTKIQLVKSVVFLTQFCVHCLGGHPDDLQVYRVDGRSGFL